MRSIRVGRGMLALFSAKRNAFQACCRISSRLCWHRLRSSLFTSYKCILINNRINTNTNTSTSSGLFLKYIVRFFMVGKEERACAGAVHVDWSVGQYIDTIRKILPRQYKKIYAPIYTYRYVFERWLRIVLDIAGVWKLDTRERWKTLIHPRNAF